MDNILKKSYVGGNGSPTTITKMRQMITYILLMTIFVCLGTTTKVSRVIDGDIFETEISEKVRLNRINVPEISDIYGQEEKKESSFLYYLSKNAYFLGTLVLILLFVVLFTFLKK